MAYLLASPASYLVPALWLILAACFPKKMSTLPWPAPLLVAFVAAAVNFATNGLVVAIVSLGAAGVLFVLLIFTGLLSRLATFALPISLAGLPLLAWVIALSPGLALSAILSVFLLRKAGGDGYVSMIVGETLSSTGILGATGGGSLKEMKPDLTRLPLPVEQDEKLTPVEGNETSVVKASRQRVPLVLLLGLSTSVVGFVAVVFG